MCGLNKDGIIIKIETNKNSWDKKQYWKYVIFQEILFFNIKAIFTYIETIIL